MKTQLHFSISACLGIALLLLLPRAGFSDCPPSPTTDTETGRIEGLVAEADYVCLSDTDFNKPCFTSAVAIEQGASFIIAFETPEAAEPPSVVIENHVLAIRFTSMGECLCYSGDCCPVRLDREDLGRGLYHHVSLGAYPGDDFNNPRVLAGFIGTNQPANGTNNARLQLLAFDFYTGSSAFCQGTLGYVDPVPGDGPDDHFPSVGMGPPETINHPERFAASWGNRTGSPIGLVYRANGQADPNQLRACDGTETVCYLDNADARWQPCVATASDGRFLVAHADSEDTGTQFPPFNIRLRQYDPAGDPVGDEVLVNDPNSEASNSIQYSPAVAFDGDNIVVVWTGFRIPGCSGPLVRVFARRFAWNPEGEGSGPIPVSRPLIVDSDPDWEAPDFEPANPTVALTNSTDPCERGSFCAAWNAERVNGTGGEIGDRGVRIQFFGRNGRSRGREFQAHVQSFDTDGVATGGDLPYLAESAAHTLQYGPDLQAVLTFSVTGSDPNTDPPRAYFTIIPEAHVAARDAADPCIKGDVDGNGLVDGRDIQAFVTLLLSGAAQCMAYVDLCAADMDSSGSIDTQDIPCIVPALLGTPCDANDPCTFTYRGWPDCNGNNVPDANDIAMGTSQDCNGNLIPDECDIANETSADVDENGVPDECQPDCNGNSIPDVKDIADATSADLNANGIPDECEPDCNANNIPDEMDVDPLDPDGNSQVSADCNANGVPDECEPDCNSNGVPDDCDIDPLDPDGDEWVSTDCNGNGMPDECDLAMGPPFGSYDCNENGIPDECDIANETSADCNANGIPDECDIAAEISEDTNENGIPDECEQEGRMGGGDSPSPPPSPLEGEGAEAAWAEYYDWVAEQQWGPQSQTPMFEQFKRSVDKLRELGLLAG